MFPHFENFLFCDFLNINNETADCDHVVVIKIFIINFFFSLLLWTLSLGKYFLIPFIYFLSRIVNLLTTWKYVIDTVLIIIPHRGIFFRFEWFVWHAALRFAFSVFWQSPWIVRIVIEFSFLVRTDIWVSLHIFISISFPRLFNFPHRFNI